MCAWRVEKDGRAVPAQTQMRAPATLSVLDQKKYKYLFIVTHDKTASGGRRGTPRACAAELNITTYC